MHSLPIFLRLAGRPVILIGSGEAAEAKQRLLIRAGAVVVGEAAGAALAIVAEPQDAEAIAARLKARGILVNVVDQPALCDFTLPAIVDRDPVLIAIGTGGVSAGLAGALRQRIETLLPAGLGALATGLRRARAAIHARWPDSIARRQAISGALAANGPLDPLTDPTPDMIAAWLTDDTHDRPAMMRIRLRSADPDDLSMREARWLGRADRIYHRPDVPAAILMRARADAPRIVCAAAPADSGPGMSVDIAAS